MRRSKAAKAVTHSKIVTTAAKRFRERGIEGIGVADVMKEAGSSVGGFYKHFESRDDLVIEALAEAFKDIDALEDRLPNLVEYLKFYLGEAHRDNAGKGCAIAALAGDVRSASTAVRTLFTQQVKHSLGYHADGLNGGDTKSRRARAILIMSAAVGGLSLARAVNDSALSRDILAALSEELIALAERPLAKPANPKSA